MPLAPLASIGIVWCGALVLIITALRGMAVRRISARHSAHELPVIAESSPEPFIPRVNPWRTGSTVIVREHPAQPEYDWIGTVLSSNRGLVTVRDLSAPYQAIELDKARVFPEGSRF